MYRGRGRIRRNQGASCSVCSSPLGTKSIVRFPACQHQVHRHCHLTGPKCSTCMASAIYNVKRPSNKQKSPSPSPSPALTPRSRATSSRSSSRSPSPMSLNVGPPPPKSLAQRRTKKNKSSAPTAAPIKTIVRGQWSTIHGDIASPEKCSPLDMCPPPRNAFGVLGRMLAPIRATYQEVSPSDDIYTAISRPYPIVVVRSDRKRGSLSAVGGAELLGQTSLMSRWPTLASIILAGADLRDLLENNYTFDEICMFPDCCLGRLLEMGMTVALILEYRGSFPLFDVIQRLGITPDVMVHRMGMRVDMMSDKGLSPKILWQIGFKGTDLFQAGLLVCYDTWDAIVDPEGYKNHIEWSKLHKAVLKCWVAHCAGVKMNKSLVQAIDEHDETQLLELCLPEAFIRALRAALPPLGRHRPLPKITHTVIRQSRRRNVGGDGYAPSDND